MTPENLDRIKRLQPKFVKAMKGRHIGDEGYLEDLGIGILHANGLMYFQSGTSVNPIWNKDILRIPKPIDWQNPERGLIGMLKNVKTLKLAENYCAVETLDGYSSFGTDPFTALLKALCEQYGV